MQTLSSDHWMTWKKPGKAQLFPFFRHLHREGLVFRLKEQLSEEERQKECETMFHRGNHKSALANKGTIKKLLKNDVRHGFSFPFKLESYLRIGQGMIQPCGRANQYTLTEMGGKVSKNRLTQEYTHGITKKDAFINNRIDINIYPPMVYKKALKQIIHFVVAL